jgi:hypothetical protein
MYCARPKAPAKVPLEAEVSFVEGCPVRRELRKVNEDHDPGVKSWFAYRIKGAKTEKAEGVIFANTREEAEEAAHVKFEATRPIEKVKIFVRELK